MYSRERSQVENWLKTSVSKAYSRRRFPVDDFHFDHLSRSSTTSGSDSRMSLNFFSNPRSRQKHPTIKKSQFYVCFLGAKESQSLRDEDSVGFALRQLARESNRRPPMKVTLQISEKGMKVIQTVPIISKSGKVKTEVMKFVIPHYSISCSTVGPPPYNDVIACTLLIFNPETRCPVHTHAYRCDSVETAALINANLQFLIQRLENQQRFFELEGRLIAQGFLAPPLPARRHHSMDNSDGNSPSSEDLDYTGIDDLDASDSDFGSGRGGNRPQLDNLQKALFQELKERLHNKEKFPILYPPKDYHMTIRISEAKPGNVRNFDIIDDRGQQHVSPPPVEEKIPAWRQYLFTKPDGFNATLNRRRRHIDDSVTSGIGSDFSSTHGHQQRPLPFNFFQSDSTPTRSQTEMIRSPMFLRRNHNNHPPAPLPTASYPLLKSQSAVPSNHHDPDRINSNFHWESPEPVALPKVSSSRLPRKNPPPSVQELSDSKGRRNQSFMANTKPNESVRRRAELNNNRMSYFGGQTRNPLQKPSGIRPKFMSVENLYDPAQYEQMPAEEEIWQRAPRINSRPEVSQADLFSHRPNGPAMDINRAKRMSWYQQSAIPMERYF